MVHLGESIRRLFRRHTATVDAAANEGYATSGDGLGAAWTGSQDTLGTRIDGVSGRSDAGDAAGLHSPLSARQGSHSPSQSLSPFVNQSRLGGIGSSLLRP
eukprot:Opistho-2@80667